MHDAAGLSSLLNDGLKHDLCAQLLIKLDCRVHIFSRKTKVVEFFNKGFEAHRISSDHSSRKGSMISLIFAISSG